jgi:hypothetical protein
MKRRKEPEPMEISAIVKAARMQIYGGAAVY